MEEYEDRLSELPQSLIHLIFSFLPIRDVVSTTLLSKRWVNLWTTVPYLNFCEIIREDDDVGRRKKVGADRIEKEDEDDGTKDEDEDNRTNLVAENNGDRTRQEDEDDGSEDEDDGTEDEYEDHAYWTEDEDNYYGTDDEDEDDVYGTEDEDEDDIYGTEDEDEEDGTDDEDEVRHERYRVNAERLRKFVSRALTLWKGIKILKFKIDIESHYDSYLISDVHMWTLFAVNNKVEDLELITSAEYWTPPCLNSCSSVRKLSFLGCQVRMDESPSWNQLKSLRIDSGNVSGELVNLILLGSPKLEEFELQLGSNCDDFSISARSLKTLKIEKYLYFDEDERYLNSLTICCPNLEKLEISGLFGKCLFIDVSSLVDANLHFYNGRDGDYDYDYYGLALPRLYELLGETLEHVFSTIQHVEKIALSDLCFQVLSARKKYLLSPLLNVKFLKLDVRRIELIDMVDLLGIFPNLKMLVIEHHASTKPPVFNTVKFETSVSKSFLQQLKIVEITVDLSDFSIFVFIEFLLKQVVLLEKLLLRPRGITSCQQQKTFSEKLLSLPKSSPTVKVILKNN